MSSSRHHSVIAIDGPAASGKSSVSHRVAAALDFLHVDTGAMYRGATWLALEKGLRKTDGDGVAAALAASSFEYRARKGKSRLFIDGVEPGKELKADRVNAAVSHVARHAPVREILVSHQRSLAQQGPLVMEGRDIGSVVFPDTPHKFYLDASPEVRALRRSAEGSKESVAERDRLDSTRKESPLVVADDAQRIDTSDLTLDEVVAEILKRLRKRGVEVPPCNTVGERNLTYRMGWGFFTGLARSFFDYEIIGAENIPARGPMLFASNHVSFLDPPLVGIATPGLLRMVARETLFDHPFFNWLYRSWKAIPIDQENPKLSTLREIIGLLQEGNRVLLFPEGERSRSGKLGKGQAGIGFLVDKSSTPVLPIRIFGAEKALPRGAKLPRRAKITVVFGEPFSFSSQEKAAMGSGKEVYQGIATEIMGRIAKLRLPASAKD